MILLRFTEIQTMFIQEMAMTQFMLDNEIAFNTTTIQLIAVQETTK